MAAFFQRSNQMTGPMGRSFVLSTGEVMKWHPVRNDLGVWPPEGKDCSDRIAGLLREAVSRGIGGVREITATEYQALLDEKKNNLAGLKQPWREELGLHVSLEAKPNPQSDGLIHQPAMKSDLAGLAAGEPAAVAPTSENGIPRPKATPK